jgi:hypothetical protein
MLPAPPKSKAGFICTALGAPPGVRPPASLLASPRDDLFLTLFATFFFLGPLIKLLLMGLGNEYLMCQVCWLRTFQGPEQLAVSFH